MRPINLSTGELIEIVHALRNQSKAIENQCRNSEEEKNWKEEIDGIIKKIKTHINLNEK